MAEEVKVTSATGGTKGSKGTGYAMIPPEFMEALAAHYGDGELKYPSTVDGVPNFWLGYPMRLNIEAFNRHWYAWLRGEDQIPDDGTDDPTAGNDHLLACAWHIIDMWRKQGGEFDDRPSVRYQESLPATSEPEPLLGMQLIELDDIPPGQAVVAATDSIRRWAAAQEAQALAEMSLIDEPPIDVRDWE